MRVAAPRAGKTNATLGFAFAILAALVSGVSVYINSLGVKTFSDPVLYTALKDGLVGVILLVPLALSSGWRAEYRKLRAGTWAWMIALALTGGSIPFALFFTGLKTTTAATGAVLNHFQFVLVAVFAVIFLKEKVTPALWAGFAVLLLGTMLGTNLGAMRWNQGAMLIAASTILFAIDFVIAKHLLRGLSTLMVMTARMTLGTAILFGYLAAGGHLAQIGHLTAAQVQFVLVTGVILLGFVVCTFTAIRHAPVSAVLAIGAASPIVTTLLQVGATGRFRLTAVDVVGLAVLLVSVVLIIVIGLRHEPRSPKLEGAPA
ncbi:MAG TPA: DMT family transporter [Candidatus Dormibacteraeota bacterium]|nr:DMT family transporter [Candidatus Dormibacteraeota bacterium]